MHHHIDSCIPLEVVFEANKPENATRARFCQKYLYDLKNKNHTPILCLTAIFEVITSIYQNISERNERETTLCSFFDLLDKYQFDFTSLNHPAIPIILELLQIEPYLDPTDSQLLACAIQTSAASFATFDKTIILSPRLINYLKENSTLPITISER